MKKEEAKKCLLNRSIVAEKAIDCLCNFCEESKLLDD